MTNRFLPGNVMAVLAAVLVASVVAAWQTGGGVSLATANADPAASDQTAQPSRPPVPLPIQRPMPEDPGRINPIGGARVSSTTPQGETAGMERPLAAQGERGAVTVPMWAKDGIFAPTAHPNRQIAIHLPGELGLGPAAWTADGGAIYGSNDVDYQVIPFSGGGVDITVTRKTVFSASTIPFGIKLPAATHLRQGNNVVLVETDAAPGNPARVIGTFSVPAATDANQALVGVTPTLGPGFPPGQSNLTVDLGPTSVFAFPVTITLSYRASDAATTGAPTPNWAGLPAGTPAASVTPPNPTGYVTDPTGAHRPDNVDPAVYAQRHSGHCQGGPDTYTSADGRAANFVAACQTQQLCLAGTPAYTSIDSCNDRLLAHLSISCVTVFGQTGDDYEACTRTAADEVSWVKANMSGGPG
ncbi:hypothetical protein [Mycolicibacterium aubagnense]|uniref:Uncharacterized protein n=1 Tax=Mycolicibacterium aubagnense TaxID=319707 RepID=A0ABM7IAL3_9MYCO|nr:hypothetical protein [Mycolicibacterium aubagnense]WGI34401.1 hypothetical protein QDT91_08705 [Mycolicibacterium aubagnense]BBX83744.1 hypothetical protein MAUB_16170 [Mycolicibacterium aubagnense]